MIYPNIQDPSVNESELIKSTESSQCNHMFLLISDGIVPTASDNKPINVLYLRPGIDKRILSSWAHHIRSHYCPDNEIDILRSGTGLSRTEYLNQMKLPTNSRGFGPATRSGDFGEILIADYLQFQLGYWVPRTRYDRKIIRDESPKGSDLIGFKFAEIVGSPNDMLSIFEVKAQFSGKKPKPRLQDAVDDSIKDEIRKAESLNAIKQRLFDQNRTDEIKRVERFQNPVDNPYLERPGAAALFSTDVFDKNAVASTNVQDHPLSSELSLLVVYGEDLMNLVHKLYEMAANEA